MASQRITLGALVEIDLGNECRAYGRVISKSELAFYHVKACSKGNMGLQEIYDSPVAFIIPVMNSAIKSGRWKIIDKRALEANFLTARFYFMKDLQTNEYSIYRNDDGSTRPASEAECAGLERAAVWEPEHVEDRLRDLFDNRVNKWVEQLKS